MTASLALDGSALDGGASVELNVPVVGDAVAYPQLAQVRELHPATENADTDVLARVECNDSEPEQEPAEVHETTAEITNPVTSNAVAIPPPPAAGMTYPDPGPRPVFSPFAGERVFSVIYWVSIAVAFIGQVWGFGPTFGGGWWYIAAALVGGIFEVTMISTGDKALNWIATGRAWWEYLPFLGISFGAASMALYFSITHWMHINAPLVPFFSGAMIGGYLMHILHGVYVSVHARKQLRAWEQEVAEVARQQREDIDRARAQAEQRRRQAEALQRQQEADAAAERQRQERDQRLAEENAEILAAAEEIRARRPRKGTRASKQVAVPLGVAAGADSLSRLREVIDSAGYKLPASDSTLKDWLREVKARLAAA